MKMYRRKCNSADTNQHIVNYIIGHGIKDNDICECYDKNQIDAMLKLYVPHRAPAEFDFNSLSAEWFNWFINLKEKILQ